MQRSSFSVVIISFNGKEFLRNTLRAVSRSEARASEIIVVDDASSDGTAEMVAQEFPEVELITNAKNSGPTAARNKGAKRATGEYIIFLDNDIEVRADTFGRLVQFLDEHSDAGIVTARLFSEDGSQRWWNIGRDPNNFQFIKNWFIQKDLNKIPLTEVRTADWVIEECFAIHRDLFEKIRGWDEQFFMYYEGPDLCRRVREAGYKVYFTPDAAATVHEGHAHSSFHRLRFFTQSKYRYYKKHYFWLKSNPLIFWAVEIVAFTVQAIKVLASKRTFKD